MKHVLLLMGGGGTEHEVSLRSAKYLEESLQGLSGLSYSSVEIGKDRQWRTSDGKNCELNFQRELSIQGGGRQKIDAAIPCLHGYPGETGDIQSFFDLIKLPYVGCGAEASKICFNKVSTKLWLDNLGIPNTPFIFLTEQNDESWQKARAFQKKWGDVFIKAASQGSSVGCYPVKKNEDLQEKIKMAFGYSSYVLIEKTVRARELEVSTYEYQGGIHTSYPGEILVPDKFYSYDEKYAAGSHAATHERAQNLDPRHAKMIQDYARKAFVQLKLRHLSRIDFFLEGDDIYLNEINTFPGMTSISLFPKMMEKNGHRFKDFLQERLQALLS